VNAAQEQALAQLSAARERLGRDYPNLWIAINANGEVSAAMDFDLLTREPGVDAGRVVFAFVAVGAWA
jgi:hypothetical protein